MTWWLCCKYVFRLVLLERVMCYFIFDLFCFLMFVFVSYWQIHYLFCHLLTAVMVYWDSNGLFGLFQANQDWIWLCVVPFRSRLTSNLYCLLNDAVENRHNGQLKGGSRKFATDDTVLQSLIFCHNTVSRSRMTISYMFTDVLKCLWGCLRWYATVAILSKSISMCDSSTHTRLTCKHQQ